jgi:TfoX/Sxy family transcriptional regulator of competence genes
MSNNQKLEKACKDALAQFEKLGDEQFYDIRSKLEFVLGSYGFDGNPVGLHEYAKKSSDILKKYKQKQPRKVSQKLLESIDSAVEGFAKEKK